MDRVGAASSKVGAGSQEQSCAADLARANWRKSSWSTYSGNCVEVAELPGDRIGVRDTRERGAGIVLVFSREEWGLFLSGIKGR